MHRYADSHICIVKHDHRFVLIEIFQHLRLRKNISDMPPYDLFLRDLEIISALLIYIKNDAIHIDHDKTRKLFKIFLHIIIHISLTPFRFVLTQICKTETVQRCVERRLL